MKQPTLVKTPAEYAAAFQEAQPVTIDPRSKMLGRIVRGKSPNDFQRLAADERRLVFVMGPDGLEQLPGKPTRDALATIGLMPEYVAGRIKQGYSFRLALFEARDPSLATWDNVLREAGSVYPSLRRDLRTHAKALPRQPLPANSDEVDLAGPSHPEFMSLERYQNLPADERTAEALRRLLRHEVHLAPLFKGDGYTYLPNGRRGMQEHVVPNGPIASLRNAVLLDLTL